MRSIWVLVDTLQCKSVTKSFRKLFSSLHTLPKVPMHCYTCSHHNTSHKLRPVVLPLADDHLLRPAALSCCAPVEATQAKPSLLLLTNMPHKLRPTKKNKKWQRKIKNFHHGHPWPKRLKNQKLSLLVTLAINDQEKQNFYRLYPWPKMTKEKQNFHHWYPLPKMLKIKTFAVVILSQKWPRKTKTFIFGNLGQKWPRKIKNFHRWVGILGRKG